MGLGSSRKINLRHLGTAADAFTASRASALVTPTAEPCSLTAVADSDPASDVAVATVDWTVAPGDVPAPSADWAGRAFAGRVGIVASETTPLDERVSLSMAELA